jgi:hypothetical protein
VPDDVDVVAESSFASLLHAVTNTQATNRTMADLVRMTADCIALPTAELAAQTRLGRRDRPASS